MRRGPGPTDYSDHLPATEDLWIDFVADCGDGWNSTYAVASEVAKDSLLVTLPNKEEEVEIKRGKILVFGGDLIYPTPTGQGYDDRLLGPYIDAFGTDKNAWPDVWALPGNHDKHGELLARVWSFPQRGCADTGQHILKQNTIRTRSRRWCRDPLGALAKRQAPRSTMGGICIAIPPRGCASLA
jgi:hypothetical protein